MKHSNCWYSPLWVFREAAVCSAFSFHFIGYPGICTTFWEQLLIHLKPIFILVVISTTISITLLPLPRWPDKARVAALTAIHSEACLHPEMIHCRSALEGEGETETEHGKPEGAQWPRRGLHPGTRYVFMSLWIPNMTYINRLCPQMNNFIAKWVCRHMIVSKLKTTSTKIKWKVLQRPFYDRISWGLGTFVLLWEPSPVLLKP